MAQAPAKNTFVNDFTSGPIMRTLITFAFPLFLSNLLQAVYNMVDMVVVGHVMGEAGLSGISIGGDVLSILNFIVMGFSAAIQIIIAQYIGAGLHEKLTRFIGTMITFLMSSAVVISVVCLLLRHQILDLLNTPAEAWDQALSYSTTCMFGLVFIYGYNIISSIMRGMGDSKRPFVFIAIAAVVNLVLDILFVAGFGWEAFGAAFATVIAQAVSFLSALIYLYKHRNRFAFDFAPQRFRIDKHELMVLLKLGIPFAIRSGAILFSKLFVGSWINSYGVTVSAVTGVGSKLEQIGNLVGSAITTAGGSMVGQNIGAGKYDRASRVLGNAFIINLISYSLMIILVILSPHTLFGLFTQDISVLDLCMEYVPVLVVAFIADALRNSMNAFTNGCGNYKFNFAVAIIDGMIARIALSLLLGLSVGLGYYGFWLGSAISGGMPFVLGIIYYLSGFWKKKSKLIGE